MRVNMVAKVVLVLSIVLGLVGCASCKGSKYAKRDDALGIADAAKFYGEEITPAQERELLNTKVIYFAYDDFSITPDNKLVVLAHARKLLQNDKLRMRVDGHTDERGSREYNIGLGERRANAVRNLMALKGVNEDKLVTVSYGKEKPVALGHSEDSWKQNRRDELVYEGQE